jgi:hypothetical protein
MGRITLFEHIHFHGQHRHIYDYESNLNAGDDNFFNDRVSSMVVEDDEWAFYRHSGYVGQYARNLGPGKYPRVGDFDIQNDDMSSLRTVDNTSVLKTAHVILFEHANFHGAHKHVYSSEPNLAAPDDSFFNDRVSSIVVLSGTWRLYRHVGFQGKYPRNLGPGAYPYVGNVDIQNDDMSSLQPAGMGGVASLPHAILFEHANLRGRHKHVFAGEPNLAANDDNFFNDRVSSVVVLSGQWAFYRHVNFEEQYAATLGPGIYRFVSELGINNDDMSSLRPI